MPISARLLRTAEHGGDIEAVRESLRRRMMDPALADEVATLDEAWRVLQQEVEEVRAELGVTRRAVGALKKAKREDEAAAQIANMRVLSACEAELKPRVDAAEQSMLARLQRLPNLLHAAVPVGAGDEANVVERDWGLERIGAPGGSALDAVRAAAAGGAAPLGHDVLLHRIGGCETTNAVLTAGHRAYFLTGVGAELSAALVTLATGFLKQRAVEGGSGFVRVSPPLMLERRAMAKVAQLEEFDEALYRVSSDAGGRSAEGAERAEGAGARERYLIATSEQPLCCLHMGGRLREEELPLRYAGVSMCFRKEAGARRDARGIFRVHQFEKVEQFCLAAPERSAAVLEEMLRAAEDFYRLLQLPFRVVKVASGQLSHAAALKYDLEAWFPASALGGEMRELVSASNCTDFQSRALDVQCVSTEPANKGVKKKKGGAKRLVHMLNATLCATSRTLCCLLENFQAADGVRLPPDHALVPLLGGQSFFPFVRDALPMPDVSSSSSSSSSSVRKSKKATSTATKALRLGAGAATVKQ
jgi:seryl-tRNA synthetase